MACCKAGYFFSFDCTQMIERFTNTIEYTAKQAVANVNMFGLI